MDDPELLTRAQSADDSLADALKRGDRAALARVITRIESSRDDHQAEAQALLERLLPLTGRSLRVGMTGVPGVGKSTFIEALGLHAIAQGHKVAVLAVDPSSSKSGGSILGDKTRMARLAQHPDAYIRPSPTGGALGGVSRRTREAMLVCEAAGFDVILVETVGVGQSETEVADMVDLFLLLLLPGSGDELQGIKRGIVELADLLVVNKADGDLLPQAKRVAADYGAAVKMLTPHDAPWQPRVCLASALQNEGIAEIWTTMLEYEASTKASGALGKKRARQATAWMWKEIREGLLGRFLHNPKVRARIAALEAQVARGEMLPVRAAWEVLD